MKKLFFYTFVIAVFFALSFAACTHIAHQHLGPTSDHFDGTYFFNLNTDPNDKRNAADFLKWFLNRNLEPWDNLASVTEEIPKRSQQLRITWVNHASVLIQINNVNILTDPIWSERASPLSWVGPQRQAPVGVQFEDLPPIDIVIISHNHYDHMDMPSLLTLNQVFQPLFITPLGNQHYLKKAGIKRTFKLDWWDSFSIQGVAITATPAQHWSKRTPFDANRALWSGFYIRGHDESVFFAGDTAYEKHFKLIQQKLGAPTIALLPIGAYKPRWFMKRAHTNPEEAVLAHIDLKAKTSIPIHYGTFQLGDDSPKSSLADLRQSIRKHDLSDGSFKVLSLGQSITTKSANHPPDKLSEIFSP